MTILITHPFISLKGDGGDATLVRPSNWNANHTTSIATGKLVGRITAGVGAFEEIGISTLVANALAATDGEAFLAALGVGGFGTGDIKYTMKATAPAGWLLMLGGAGAVSTIGNAASGATLYANAAALNLFTLVYNSISDTDAPVSGGRTGNAVNDFNANKTIRIPNPVGRSPIGAGGATDAPPGGGAATTAKVIGRGYGVETVTLTSAQIPAHTHPNSLNDPSHIHLSCVPRFPGGGSGGASGGGFSIIIDQNTSSAFTGMTITNAANTGGGGSHENLHSSIGLNVMVKL